MTGIELFALPAIMGGGTMTLGGALGAASLATGAIAGIQGAQQQASAQRAQGEMARQNAMAQRQAGHNSVMQAEAEAARIQDTARRTRAQAFNRSAGMGIDAATGSSGDVLADMAAGSALDAEIARWRGSQEMAARERQANLLDAQAQGFDQQARSTTRAAWWRTGGTLMTGGAQIFGNAGGSMDVFRKAWTPSMAPQMKAPL